LDIRKLENTDKYGYYIYIKYDGKKFHAFDEMQGKITVKGAIRKTLEDNGITWAKGIQQAGRTDAKVSANENILYISTKYNCFDYDKLKDKLNKNLDGVKIKKIEKTFPNLVLPEIVKERVYTYKIVKKLKKSSDKEIIERCNEWSGEKDVSSFTDHKGKQLLQKVRKLNIKYEQDKLIFVGESFLPKQIRIMASYILSGEKRIYPGKHLVLEKIELMEKAKNKIFRKIEDIQEKNVIEVEKIDEIYYFYVKKENKGKLIGKNGQNIKKLKKMYGNIVVKEI